MLQVAHPNDTSRTYVRCIFSKLTQRFYFRNRVLNLVHNLVNSGTKSTLERQMDFQKGAHVCTAEYRDDTQKRYRAALQENLTVTSSVGSVCGEIHIQLGVHAFSDLFPIICKR